MRPRVVRKVRFLSDYQESGFEQLCAHR